MKFSFLIPLLCFMALLPRAVMAQDNCTGYFKSANVVLLKRHQNLKDLRESSQSLAINAIEQHQILLSHQDLQKARTFIFGEGSSAKVLHFSSLTSAQGDVLPLHSEVTLKENLSPVDPYNMFDILTSGISIEWKLTSSLMKPWPKENEPRLTPEELLEIKVSQMFYFLNNSNALKFKTHVPPGHRSFSLFAPTTVEFVSSKILRLKKVWKNAQLTLTFVKDDEGVLRTIRIESDVKDRPDWSGVLQATVEDAIP